MKCSNTDAAIVAGCLMFIGVLFISAYWEPDIRWLHFYQSWLYLATIVMVIRQSRWGYFLGIVTATFWNYVVLFVNTFFHSGREQLEILLITGTIPRPENFIAIPGFVAHLLMIVCCIIAYFRLPNRAWTDVGRFAISGAISVGYFAIIIACAQPRYLPIFSRLFSPHIHF